MTSGWKLLLLGMTAFVMPALIWAGEPIKATDRDRAEVTRLEREQQRLLSQVRRELGLLPPEPPPGAALSPKETVLLARRRELVSLLTEVEQRINRDKAGRSKYISSSVKDEPYKSYFQRFQRRVEEAGTREFPRIKGEAIYGEVLLNISIKPSGKIQDIEVLKSPSTALTDHSVKLLRSLAPFEEYASEMGPGIEQIVLTVPFSYRKE